MTQKTINFTKSAESGTRHEGVVMSGGEVRPSRVHKRNMDIVYQDLNRVYKPDSFSLHLLESTVPEWLYKGLRIDIMNSLRGFSEEMALEIADNLIDAWSGLALHLTGIGHIDTMLWDFYWRILECAHRKNIQLSYEK